MRAYFGVPYAGEHEEGTLPRAVNKFIEQHPDGGVLEEIGSELGSKVRRNKGKQTLTRERVRQLLAEAIASLKEAAKKIHKE